MSRFKKELQKRGILYTASDEDVARGAEYDVDHKLVDITDKFIITIMHSSVIDPILFIYDRKTLAEIGQQDLFKGDCLFGSKNPWGSWGNVEVKV